MEELVQGRTYLLKYIGVENLLSATILVVTNKAYHIRWNLGLGSEDKWIEKEVITEKYSVIEDISDVVTSKDEKDLKSRINYVQCYVCKGTGSVMDTSSNTGGKKTCPACFGNRLVLDSIQTES